jgi:hypothetical protein
VVSTINLLILEPMLPVEIVFKPSPAYTEERSSSSADSLRGSEGLTVDRSILNSLLVFDSKVLARVCAHPRTPDQATASGNSRRIMISHTLQHRTPQGGRSSFEYFGLSLLFFLSMFVPSGILRAITVTVNPGDRLQALVDTNPAGTKFLITTGIHRLQSVIPKSYNEFIGQPGAVLSGAMLLTSFSPTGNLWVANVAVPWKTPDPGWCDSIHPACSLPEDLFFDNSPRTRVLSLPLVRPGAWYLDYSTGNVYMGDNPSGRTVELSVLPYAFSGGATGVRITVLNVEKYASSSNSGAIQANRQWVVGWSDIRYNHGAGLQINSGMRAYHNNLHHNGQLGVTGAGTDAVIEYNQIYRNNYAGYATKYAGGSKFVNCYNLIVRYNYAHDNNGPGLWTDINNDYVLYEYNRTSHNLIAGIFHEISYHATIRYNQVSDDGYNPAGSSLWWGAGIKVNTSSNVTIYGNTVTNCMNGISAIYADRGNGPKGPYVLENIDVHDNTITQVNGSAVGIAKANVFGDSVYTSMGNHAQNNIFNLAYPTGHCFYWIDGYWNLEQWNTYANLH